MEAKAGTCVPLCLVAGDPPTHKCFEPQYLKKEAGQRPWGIPQWSLVDLLIMCVKPPSSEKAGVKAGTARSSYLLSFSAEQSTLVCVEPQVPHTRWGPRRVTLYLLTLVAKALAAEKHTQPLFLSQTSSPKPPSRWGQSGPSIYAPVRPFDRWWGVGSRRWALERNPALVTLDRRWA